MSIHVISWVLRHSPAEGSARLVLIVLADRANDDGTAAYPAIETICREARIRSKTTVRDALKRLETDGAIEYEGISKYRTKSWRVITDRRDSSSHAADWTSEAEGHRHRKGQDLVPPGSDPSGSGVPRSDPEPSIEPPNLAREGGSLGGFYRDDAHARTRAGVRDGAREPNEEDLEAWNRVRNLLKDELHDDYRWHSIIGPLQLAAIVGHTLLLAAPDRALTTVKERYLPMLVRSVREAFDPKATVEIVVDEGGRNGN